MTTQEFQNAAKYSRWAMGWVYLLYGFLQVAVCSYLCLADDRPKMVVLDAIMAMAGFLIIWFGLKRIHACKQKV